MDDFGPGCPEAPLETFNQINVSRGRTTLRNAYTTFKKSIMKGAFFKEVLRYPIANK